MKNPRRLPEFSDVREEIRFWDSPEANQYIIEKAGEAPADGKREPMIRITMRMETDLIDDLKELAEWLDMPYQALTRALMKRGLWKVKHGQPPPKGLQNQRE